MLRKDIEAKVKEILKNKFSIDIDNIENIDKISLLDPYIGMMPRDLLTLFFDLQDTFNIKFDENDIIENRFDLYINIVNSIEKKQLA